MTKIHALFALCLTIAACGPVTNPDGTPEPYADKEPAEYAIEIWRAQHGDRAECDTAARNADVALESTHKWIYVDCPSEGSFILACVTDVPTPAQVHEGIDAHIVIDDRYDRPWVEVHELLHVLQTCNGYPSSHGDFVFRGLMASDHPGDL